MQTKDLIIDQSCQWQVVKQVGEILPHICVAILAKTLVVKAVHLSDLARLMITTQDGHTVWVTHL